MVSDSPSEGSLEEKSVRSLLDELLKESRLYSTGADYKALLDFVVKLRNFAPFNAMLLQIQKPGLSYAASARDWVERFGRWPREGARPLLILWPFGPVALVYDVVDTEGESLPADVSAFRSVGAVSAERIGEFQRLLHRRHIAWVDLDAGDNSAGYIRVVSRSQTKKEATHYRLAVNQNHSLAVQFTTITHELGHLFLGHLGQDDKLNAPRRSWLSHAQDELEAESVAYLVCKRNGVDAKSETYLSKFVGSETAVENIDIYQVMRAAGQIEATLQLTAPTRSDLSRR